METITPSLPCTTNIGNGILGTTLQTFAISVNVGSVEVTTVMSFTLATLKSTVQDYLQVNETTFNDNLDEFIRESEDRIFSMVQLPEQRKNVQGTMSLNNRFLATPSDFYAPFSVAVISSNIYSYLMFKHPSFIKEYSPDYYCYWTTQVLQLV
jgi:hypothetical protein